MMSMRGTELLLIVSFLVLGVLVTTTFGANVTYDNRALVIDGNRRVLISGSIHYPRSTPDMWPDLIQKSKDGGLDVIETYVFWNLHEPVRNQYDFEGGKDLVKFVKLVAAAGLYVHIRIGPYVCAEWNYGGFPLWLHFIPGIEFRTDNEPFKAEMKRFTAKIVDMMKQENLYASQGGPIILSQIENEYGNIDSAYGSAAKTYINWAASMATSLDTGVPWVMCQQADAPDPIINTCNGFYCDQFTPNSANKPKMWTENWTGWFLSFGGAVPYRPVEDIAFAVARFFQRGGTFQNYYMYHGGTNFGRTTGGPFIATSYDYDAPIDEYGLLRQPKWGHLKDVHKAIKLCEPAMVATGPTITSLGPNLEAGVYKTGSGLCAAFLANVDSQSNATVNFNGNSYNLPAWSVSILPDYKNAVLNAAKYSREQASRDPDNYFNLRWLSCPAAEMVDGSKVLYYEQAFWRTPRKPFRQRFFMVKPCPKEMKCDVELSTYAIRDAEEYKNYCDRPKDQRPQPEEVIGDIAEHLTTIYLKRCERGKRCLNEGSTPPDGFPNSWNGAAYCTSELSVLKNNEIHTSDRGYDDDGNQVWGVRGGPYEFKPAPASSFVDMFPLNFPPQSMDKRIEGSFVLQE